VNRSTFSRHKIPNPDRGIGPKKPMPLISYLMLSIWNGHHFPRMVAREQGNSPASIGRTGKQAYNARHGKEVKKQGR
jgi:hypothetical protein